MTKFVRTFTSYSRENGGDIFWWRNNEGKFWREKKDCNLTGRKVDKCRKAVKVRKQSNSEGSKKVENMSSQKTVNPWSHRPIRLNSLVELNRIGRCDQFEKDPIQLNSTQLNWCGRFQSVLNILAVCPVEFSRMIANVITPPDPTQLNWIMPASVVTKFCNSSCMVNFYNHFNLKDCNNGLNFLSQTVKNYYNIRQITWLDLNLRQ